MRRTMITLGTSHRAVQCRICGERMAASEPKARLEPVAGDDRLFYYFHVACLVPELQAGLKALRARSAP